MPIGPAGQLGTPEIVCSFGAGCFPDGFAFDEAGGIWITCLVSNRLLRFHHDELAVVLEDVNPEFVAAAERAFASGAMAAEHLGPIPGTILQQLTSIAFGGPDRRTAYLGSLHAGMLFSFQADVAGVATPFADALRY
jgi:sugar lactone lactonase YvrE